MGLWRGEFPCVPGKPSPMRALRHRDFLILWLGALLSFTGTWVQSIAQGWYVFELTHDKEKLAFVTFCASAPIAVIGPIAGTISDMVDKRKVLVVCQSIFAMGALFLAASIHFQFVRYEYIVMVAIINGCASAIEMPTRQSIVSTVVPREDLASAIPMQATTFNLARIVGPAIGGYLLSVFGPKMCYFVNGLSYSGLILAALAIRTDLSSLRQEASGIRQLIVEGIRFTLKDIRLRTLFIMEGIVSSCGLVYMALMAAIAKEMLHTDEKGLGTAFACIGAGALLGLGTMAWKGSQINRGMVVRVAMTFMGLGMIGLSFVNTFYAGLPLLALLGLTTILQFNSTNTLFQLIAPERLRGRVIAMHMWALSGIGPFGLLVFGKIAEDISIPVTLQAGGVCVLLGAIWGWTQKKAFVGLP